MFRSGNFRNTTVKKILTDFDQPMFFSLKTLDKFLRCLFHDLKFCVSSTIYGEQFVVSGCSLSVSAVVHFYPAAGTRFVKVKPPKYSNINFCGI